MRAPPASTTEIAKIERELAAPRRARPDLAALTAAVEAAQAGGRRRRAARRSRPKPRTPTRAQQLDAARTPLADAERRVQRLDTEAKT